VLAGPIILLLFGPEFAPAIPALQISIWAIVFALITVPNARLMLVDGKQTPVSWLRGLGAVASIALNLLLIPRLGINGAAVARVLATVIYFISLYVYVQRNLLRDRLLPLAVRPAIATAIMAVVVWYLRDSFLLIPIITGIVVYGVLIVLLGGVTEEDRSYLRQLFDYKPAA
jgi:O-antigen/teichoic acid export membrane protein